MYDYELNLINLDSYVMKVCSEWSSYLYVSLQSDVKSPPEAMTTAVWFARPQWFNTLRPRLNGCHFADDSSKYIIVKKKCVDFDSNFTEFFPKGSVVNIPELVQIMASRRPGDKPLSEPMMVSLPTRICVTRPQWFNPAHLVWKSHYGIWTALGINTYYHLRAIRTIGIIVMTNLWNNTLFIAENIITKKLVFLLRVERNIEIHIYSTMFTVRLFAMVLPNISEMIFDMKFWHDQTILRAK